MKPALAVSLREEGKVAWLESPNGLDATGRIPSSRKIVNGNLLKFLPNSKAVFGVT